MNGSLRVNSYFIAKFECSSGFKLHKNVDIWRYFWSVFSGIWSEYGPEKCSYLSTFYAVILIVERKHFCLLGSLWYTLVLILKLHWCTYKNLPIPSSPHKYNMPKVSHISTFYFLRYTHPRYMSCLFKNIEKQEK